MDVFGDLVGQPTQVPTRLGGVHGRHQRHVQVVFEGDRGVRHQPVVGVYDIEFLGACRPESGSGEGVVEGHRPGQQRRGVEVQKRGVLWGPNDANPVDGLVQCRRRAVGVVAVPGGHCDGVAGCGQRGRQGVDVTAESADKDRRVLPREKQDAFTALRACHGKYLRMVSHRGAENAG